MTISIDPPAEAASIRTADPREADRLSHSLAQAFYDDPVFAWFWPRPHRRYERIVRYFRGVSLESTLRFGHVYTTDGIAGGALWLPPGEAHASTMEIIRLVPEMIRVWGRDIGRAFKGISYMEANHPHEDHWYLWLLGVAPEWRGAGLGSSLLRPILERCDADRMPAYLEATSPLNRRLYERHGFEVTRELRLPDGPPMWAMWREPVTG